MRSSEPLNISVVNNRGEIVLFTIVFRSSGGHGVPNWNIPNPLPMSGLEATLAIGNQDNVPA
jgi:hypothetical protein